MNRSFKNFTITIGVIIGLLILFILPVFLIEGGVYLYENFYEIIGTINLSLFGLVVVLLLLSIIPDLRKITSSSIFICSYIFGATLWLISLYYTYSLWGILGVIIGFLFLGIGMIPLAMLALLLHALFIDLGILILLVVLVFVFRFLSVWISSKYRKVNFKNKYLQYILAIFIGIISGQFIPMPIINIFGKLLGQEVINSQTSLSIVNFSFMVLAGFITGFLTGFISRNKGILLAAIAQFTPLTLLVLFSIIINRQLPYQPYGLSFWTWVGLVPALIGGYLGEKFIKNTNTINEN